MSKSGVKKFMDDAVKKSKKIEKVISLLVEISIKNFQAVKGPYLYLEIISKRRGACK